MMKRNASRQNRWANRASSRAPRHRDRTFILPGTFLLLLLSLLLGACVRQTTPPVPGENTGTLQLTVQGLPEGVEASVGVVGPEDYRSTVTGSQILSNLRTGSYTLTAEPVSYQGLTYTARTDTSGQAEAVVDVTKDKTTAVTLTYTSVGGIDESDIAPGITREGVVAEDAFDDYSFVGFENVPLLFDFTGTGKEGRNGRYSFSFYQADDLDTPLYSSLNQSTYAQDPLVGFTPPENGDYVLRIVGQQDVVDYTVGLTYFNGPPEARKEPVVLTLGETAEGAVTGNSFDTYRFTGTFNQPVLLSFSYDKPDARYNGTYVVEFYRAGQETPLETSSIYGTFGTPPQIDFTPPEDGDYLIRVVGRANQRVADTNLVRYRFVLEPLE